MFDPEDRDRFKQRLTRKANSDPRIVAAAAVGSTASGGDRWSDLDLSFAVGEGHVVDEVLEDWTQSLIKEFDAVVLFDLPFMTTIYRVFLLPGTLQVDLSFTPAAEFGALGPKFHLLFGEAVRRPLAAAPSPEHIFGLGVHHAVRARICLERGRLWQAEYWIHALRDEALSLACLRAGQEARHGRGFDDLPADVLSRFQATLPERLTGEDLESSLASATICLLQEGAGLPAGERLRSDLEDLSFPAVTRELRANLTEMSPE
jgi:hypothetical protein